MNQSTFLSYVYGFGILLMLFFIYNEYSALRLRFHSLDAVIPSLEAKVGPSGRVPSFQAVSAEPREVSPNLIEAVSNWIRDDAYPRIGTVINPYDTRSAGPMEPQVSEVGWWGGQP